VSSPPHRHADCLSQFWKDLEEAAVGKGLNLRSWHRRAKAVAERSGTRGYISYPTFQRWVRSRTRLSDWGWGDVQPIVLTAVGDQERDWKPWQARWSALQRHSDRRGGHSKPDLPIRDESVQRRYALTAIACVALAFLLAVRIVLTRPNR
jgi:hypothetical protein